MHVNAEFAYMALASICQSGKTVCMKERPNRIKEIRETLDITIEQLADSTGLSVSYISRLESGDRNLSVKNLNLISSALGVLPQDLLLTKDSSKRTNVVAVMGRIGAGAEILPELEQLPPEGLFEIETPFPIPADAIAFEVEGESMWPRYDPGDIIICWRQGVNIEEVLGWEAAVKIDTGQRYLKRILRGSSKGTFDLESHNAPPIRGVRIEWIAAVQSVIRSGQWRKLSAAGRANLIRKMTKAA